ncbi:MAG: superoxide dismutase family protein [Candidatus Omnitrophica bacterium]|nr:superoxide dismutase family protein [Candidatus Omnitrophota bacterium]
MKIMNLKMFLFFAFLAIGVFPAVAGDNDEGIANIKGTSVDSQLSGVVSLKEVAEGVKVDVKLSNVPNPGPHGFHIHEKGSCEDAGNAAGGHYNPREMPHGLANKDEMAHAGDMGNIIIDENGEGFLETILPGVTLRDGDHNLEGRAIILHEKADDFGQPTGNAGGRIGCGIIEVTKEQS